MCKYYLKIPNPENQKLQRPIGVNVSVISVCSISPTRNT